MRIGWICVEKRLHLINTIINCDYQICYVLADENGEVTILQARMTLYDLFPRAELVEIKSFFQQPSISLYT